MIMLVICARCRRLNRKEYSFFGRFDFDGKNESRCKLCDAKSFRLGFKSGLFSIRYSMSRIRAKNKAPEGAKE